jgi:hypothetical protein
MLSIMTKNELLDKLKKVGNTGTVHRHNLAKATIARCDTNLSQYHFNI